MKLSMLGLVVFLPVAAAGLRGNRDGAGQAGEEVSASQREQRSPAAVVEMRAFAAEIEAVEGELAIPSEFQRDDLLVMYGRSSAASGRFDVAAAAYAMFLNEFGTGHPNSENVAVRLADCLFPFKYDEINVVHAPSGPRLDPIWRMGFSPRPEHLRQAIHGFELAASLTQDPHAKGSALLKLGWVHRVLGDWDASTAAWDRCANVAAPTKSGADALWLAAENLEWTNRPVEAAERLGRMGRDDPGDARTSAALDRIEHLQAESRRSPDWLSDPVVSLQSEIDARAGSRTPQEAYRAAVQWLQRRGEREALIVASRWAGIQNAWPIMDCVQARLNLADALLNENPHTDSARTEAVQALQSVAATAPDDAWSVPAAIRAYRLLVELNRPQEADRFLADFGKTRIKTRPWGPVLLTAEIESLVQHGETALARDKLARLRALHPEYDLTGRIDGVLGGAKQEGGKSR